MDTAVFSVAKCRRKVFRNALFIVHDFRVAVPKHHEVLVHAAIGHVRSKIALRLSHKATKAGGVVAMPVVGIGSGRTIATHTAQVVVLHVRVVHPALENRLIEAAIPLHVAAAVPAAPVDGPVHVAVRDKLPQTFSNHR